MKKLAIMLTGLLACAFLGAACTETVRCEAHQGGKAAWGEQRRCELCGELYGEKRDYYELGDHVREFMATTTDGVFTLSETLEEKELVVLHFFTSWMIPCKEELSVLNEAYLPWRSYVDVLAVGVEDDARTVETLKADNEFAFQMASDGETGLRALFPSEGMPTTVMIDKHGEIVYYEAGALKNAEKLFELFDRFIDGDVVLDELPETDDSSETPSLPIDPVPSNRFETSKQVYEGEYVSELSDRLGPRGFMYKFIPERSGAYRVYSNAPTGSTFSPVCFYYGAYAEEGRYEYYTGTENFEFYALMEAGKAYYFALASDGEEGTYPFRIEFKGEKYPALVQCATVVRYDEETGMPYVDGIEYEYSEGEACYYVKGTRNKIYLDILRPNGFLGESLYSVAKRGLGTLTANGVDYDPVFVEYGKEAAGKPESDEKRYFIPLNKELLDALQALIKEWCLLEGDWQKLCYYEVVWNGCVS